MARRFDQPGDDRGFGNAQFGGRVAEELAAGAVDPIGPAAEIDFVEIEFENLLLGEFPFERHR